MSELRAEAHRFWQDSAPHWARAAQGFARVAEPVTAWLIDAAELTPGARVLELGAGPSPVGFAAAERVAPGGEVVITDAIEEMLAPARERGGTPAGMEWGIEDAEAIDRPAASFDAVLSRWGLMFTVDPDAPFREIRRVLKPGGRVAIAAWAPAPENPWFAVPGRTLLEQGLTEPPPPGDLPGPFRFAAPGRLDELLAGVGFADVEVSPLPFTGSFGSFAELWDLASELGNSLRNALALTDERGADALRAGIEEGFAPYRRPDGGYDIPLVALVARATA